jgi:SAM-dependent methyltransferase
MEPEEYAVLDKHEATHWWFAGLRAMLADVLRQAGLGPSSLVLDAGCGTGKLLRQLDSQLAVRGVGIDRSPHATAIWKRRGVPAACRASVNELPFRTGVFDAAVCVNVLECSGVNQTQAYGELCRVVRVGGLVALVVPAYRWLHSAAHHRAVHAVRRYTMPEVRSLIVHGPVTVQRLTHLFPSFLPAIAAYRLWEGLTATASPSRPRLEVGPVPLWLNSACSRLLGMERKLLQFVDLPFGSSILAVAQKRPAAG